MAEDDYRLAASLGLRTLRDGLRWHLIESRPGQFDWSSFLPMLRSAQRADVEVIWDLMHYGWPDDLDIWSASFVDRFAAFARQVARLVKDESDVAPFYVPINEISFLAWGGGQFAVFNPMATGRGDELKRQLIRAAVAGMEAIWDIEPRARMAQVDPAINVLPDPARPESAEPARKMRDAQFTAWDMLAGRINPELGGSPRCLDVIGINFYCHNQWIDRGGPIDWHAPTYRPFREMLGENYQRYRRPLFIAETGIEAELRPEWFRYVCDEVAAAIVAGIPVQGICLYPIMNHPGWDDDRHCPNGLLDYRRDTFARSIHMPLAEELHRQQLRFRVLLDPASEPEPSPPERLMQGDWPPRRT